MPVLLGLDIGTSGGRAVAIDSDGRALAEASRAWRYRTEAPGVCELDPEEAFSALASAAAEVAGAVGRSSVAALGVTSQRTGVVILDAGGRALYSGPNADGRAIAEGLALEREHGERIWRIAGRLPAMLYLPARLAWLRKNRPEIAERARAALSFSDWAVHRLTGVAATEPTQAAEMGVYDLAAGQWSGELCEALGVPPSLLPPILGYGRAAGGLLPEAASALGLLPGIPVAGAGADTQCAALGAGVVAPADACVVAGTTMLAGQVVPEPRIDPRGRLWTSPHPAGGFVVEAHCGEAGAPLDWFLALSGENHEWLGRAASSAAPGAGGLSFVDAWPSAMGDFALLRTGALSFPAPLLALARPREDVARAVVEGVAFAACAGLEWTAEAVGQARSVALAGGVSRIGVFGRVMATALGRPVRVAGGAGASARGAAIVAAVAAGIHSSVAEAARAMADPGTDVEPVAEWAGATALAFSAWRERAAQAAESALTVRKLMERGDPGGGDGPDASRGGSSRPSSPPVERRDPGGGDGPGAQGGERR
ncbi:MAG: FGGY-family carbohydrate kinase [Acidobacteria bacterium]|nr:FGGY-family carbohydrate kinase [Acidobacteriota bacterium]